MNRVKQQLSILTPIIYTFILCLVLLTISRLLLMVWQWPRVDEANGLFNIITSGVRVDVSTLCSLLIIPALVTCFLSSNTLIGRIWNHVLRVWVTFTIWLIVYMEVVTVPFIIEYDLRPNRLFIEYLIYPKEVFGMLFSGYKLELFIGLLVTIVSLVLGRKSYSMINGTVTTSI
jgi:phosphoglycerol transferase MdoB-like AlkP superfamily enzyme